MKCTFYMAAIAVVAILNFSCRGDENSLTQFDIGKAAAAAPSPFNIFDIAENVEYFPMKTVNDDSFLGNITRFHMYGDTVIFVSNIPKQVSAFGINSGDYLYSVGREGNGPNEYYSSFRTIFLDDKIYIDGVNKFKVYDKKGPYLYDLDVKLDGEPVFLSNAIPERISTGGNNFAAYHFNIRGMENRLISIFDENGNVVKTFPNDRLFDRRAIEMGGFSFFYKYKDGVFFGEQSNDTIYKLTPERLTPHLVLKKSPDQRVSYENPGAQTSNGYLYMKFTNSKIIYCLSLRRTNILYAIKLPERRFIPLLRKWTLLPARYLTIWFWTNTARS